MYGVPEYAQHEQNGAGERWSNVKNQENVWHLIKYPGILRVKT